MCDVVDEEGKIVDAGWSVQFVMSGTTWTAAELWSVRTSTMKNLILQ